MAAFAHDDAGLECALHGMTPHYVVFPGRAQRPKPVPVYTISAASGQSAAARENPDPIVPLESDRNAEKAHRLKTRPNRCLQLTPLRELTLIPTMVGV